MEYVKEILKKFGDAAGRNVDDDPREANKAHDEVHACYKVLKNTEAGRQGIIGMMSDENPHIRLVAAARSLPWCTEQARNVLEALCTADVPWQVTFSAEMVLKEYDKGRLTFDY